MSTLYVDTINEKTSGNGVQIPGHVVQIQNGTLLTRTTMSSTSVAATNLTASITPTSTNSKILIEVTSGWGMSDWNLGNFYLHRNGSNIISGTSGNAWQIFQNQVQGGSSSNSNGFYVPLALSYMDTPSSTSSLTYSLHFSTDNGAATVYFNGRPQSDQPGYAQMTLKEIAQ